MTLIKTSWKPLIQHTVNVQIQGETFSVHITKESGPPGARWQLRRERDFNSSEEINSNKGDDEVWYEGEIQGWRHKLRAANVVENIGATVGE